MPTKNNVPSHISNAVISLLQGYYPALTPENLAYALDHVQGPSMEPAAAIKRKMTRSECAEILGVSLNTIHRDINAGRLKVIHISPRLVRIDPESVQALLDNGIPQENEVAE